VVNEESAKKLESYNVVDGIDLSKAILDQNSSILRPLYYHFDGLGSVADTTDSGANVLTAYRYDAFGHTLSGGQGYDNDLQFVGAPGVRNQGRDGLTYMRNRWYDPTVGRFLTKDPIGFRGGINLYEYAMNNPVHDWDSSGLDTLPTASSQGYNFSSSSSQLQPVQSNSQPLVTNPNLYTEYENPISWDMLDKAGEVLQSAAGAGPIGDSMAAAGEGLSNFAKIGEDVTNPDGAIPGLVKNAVNYFNPPSTTNTASGTNTTSVNSSGQPSTTGNANTPSPVANTDSGTSGENPGHDGPSTDVTTENSAGYQIAKDWALCGG
jgi:RHS repeat-associated protein